MSLDAGMRRWGGVSKIALVALVGSLASACSSDSMRLSRSSLSGPFTNPFSSANQTAQVEPTAPDPVPAQVAAAPVEPIQSQPLAPIQTGAAPGVAAASVTSNSGGWTAAGGTQVTIGAGDSLATISQRYGVPSQAILSANGLASASQVQPGSRIVIPVYNAAAPTQVAAAPAQSKAKVADTKTPPKPGETANQRVRPGMAASQPTASPAAKAQAAQPAQKVPEPAKVAKLEPEKPVAVAAPKPALAPEPAKPTAKEPEQTASLPAAPAADFRWPARGRVIAGFGANGGNEGINIALPEGTPVKAAEDGTVTYAGSEVKGYGNLVLIKHDNGYVSAYAHNGELAIKRGERVKRGQVIAKSGQTGNVTSPQLHFEIRKGQAPVDPMAYLGGN
jgi:murein DD-endopeptidase MepM/ murein hydrolase activator NlpD